MDVLKEFDVDPDDERAPAKFARVININAALPGHIRDKITAETPLRDILPGGWPTVGDLFELVRQFYIPKDER